MEIRRLFFFYLSQILVREMRAFPIGDNEENFLASNSHIRIESELYNRFHRLRKNYAHRSLRNRARYLAQEKNHKPSRNSPHHRRFDKD